MRSYIGCSVFSLLVILSANHCFASSNNELTPEPTLGAASAISDKKILRNSVEKYQDTIEKIEVQAGVYDSKLIQELLSLGSAYQTQDRHDDAVKTLERSLHLSRINEGLYSQSQIPILEKIIQSLKQLEKWKLVSNRYFYQYWLYSVNFDQNDIEMLDIDFKLANWYLKSYSLNVAANPAQSLLNSIKLFEQAAQIISIQYGEADIRLIEALNGLMIANYMVATHVPSTSRDIGFEDSGHHQVSKTFSNIDYMKRKSFSTGRDIIKRELNILSKQDSIDHHRVLKTTLRLADWHLMYNKRQAAMSYYRDAYNYALQNHSDNQFVNELFAQPVALPDFPNLKNNTKVNPSDSELTGSVKYVHASFNVTRFGTAQNIKIISSNPPDNTSMRAKVLKSLRVAKFRPRIDQGVPVLTKQTQLHVFVR